MHCSMLPPGRMSIICFINIVIIKQCVEPQGSVSAQHKYKVNSKCNVQNVVCEINYNYSAWLCNVISNPCSDDF